MDHHETEKWIKLTRKRTALRTRLATARSIDSRSPWMQRLLTSTARSSLVCGDRVRALELRIQLTDTSLSRLDRESRLALSIFSVAFLYLNSTKISDQRKSERQSGSGMRFFKQIDVMVRPSSRSLKSVAATVRLAVVLILVLWPFFIAVIFRVVSSDHGHFPLYF